MKIRHFALATTVLLAGCATGPGTMYPSKPAPGMPDRSGRYEIVAGRGPELVADLRAAPPPAEPDVVEGRSMEADQKRLAQQSYMHIGTSHFAATDPAAREDALKQGQRVGADRVILYRPADGAGETTVAYYVRFKLPFGATFRDLRAEELGAIGTGGGVAIGSVVDNTPASRANLLTGDVVLELDGKAIVDRADFQARLRAHAGKPVTLTIVRNGETLKRVVRLGVMAAGG